MEYPMASGWFNNSPGLDQRVGNGLALPSHFALLAPDAEHVALLGNPDGFYQLLRKDDLLDEGVAAVFRLAGAEAELSGPLLSFWEVHPFRVSDVACRAGLQAPALRTELR